jgi:UDPglucose 6-dehydrogenase
VHAHDPKARPAALDAHVIWHETSYEAADGADVLVILTEWDEYRDLDLKLLARLMAGRTIIDCRNLLDFAQATQRGFRHIQIGRPIAPAAPSEQRTRGHGASLTARRAAASPA